MQSHQKPFKLTIFSYLVHAVTLIVLGLPTHALNAEPLVDACKACHGAEGVSVLPKAANLAGQHKNYLLKQLKHFRDGTRIEPSMAGLLDNMSDSQLDRIATYYSELPAGLGQAADENLDLAEQIYRGGILEKDVAACTACHSPTGNGNASAGYPLLRGQKIIYTKRQLINYREKKRNTDEYHGGVMQDIAGRLTDTEIEALANYIQGLRPYTDEEKRSVP